MVSIFVGSIKIAIEERPAAHLRQLVKYVFTFVLVSGSAAAFVGMAIRRERRSGDVDDP